MYVTATNDIICYYTMTFLRKLTEFNTIVLTNPQIIRRFCKLYKISNENRFIHTNALLDITFDATLLNEKLLQN